MVNRYGLTDEQDRVVRTVAERIAIIGLGYPYHELAMLVTAPRRSPQQAFNAFDAATRPHRYMARRKIRKMVRGW